MLTRLASPSRPCASSGTTVSSIVCGIEISTNNPAKKAASRLPRSACQSGADWGRSIRGETRYGCRKPQPSALWLAQFDGQRTVTDLLPTVQCLAPALLRGVDKPHWLRHEEGSILGFK